METRREQDNIQRIQPILNRALKNNAHSATIATILDLSSTDRQHNEQKRITRNRKKAERRKKAARRKNKKTA